MLLLLLLLLMLRNRASRTNRDYVISHTVVISRAKASIMAMAMAGVVVDICRVIIGISNRILRAEMVVIRISAHDGGKTKTWSRIAQTTADELLGACSNEKLFLQRRMPCWWYWRRRLVLSGTLHR